MKIGTLDAECYYEGNFHNAYRIQKQIRKTLGVPTIVKDYINDNMCLKSIEIQIIGEPYYDIDIDYSSKIDDKTYKWLDGGELRYYFQERGGMNIIYDTTIDAVKQAINNKNFKGAKKLMFKIVLDKDRLTVQPYKVVVKGQNAEKFNF